MLRLTEVRDDVSDSLQSPGCHVSRRYIDRSMTGAIETRENDAATGGTGPRRVAVFRSRQDEERAAHTALPVPGRGVHPHTRLRASITWSPRPFSQTSSAVRIFGS
jgi:hypothetical protein